MNNHDSYILLSILTMSLIFKFLMTFLFIGTVSGLHDSIPLKNVESLTFGTNQFTNGRRSSPIPQLNCVGGNAAHLRELHPSTVQCYNRGSDGLDAQWECQAELDNRVKFGAVDVVCEGYDSPDDPNILKGSCGLEYRLECTSTGHRTHSPNRDQTDLGSDVFAAFVWLIVIVVVLSSCCSGPQHHHHNRNNGYCGYGGYGGYGGGGGWGGFGTGAAMGYTMGRSNRTNYNRGGGRSYGGSSYSGTRTASGFGGTRRR